MDDDFLDAMGMPQEVYDSIQKLGDASLREFLHWRLQNIRAREATVLTQLAHEKRRIETLHANASKGQQDFVSELPKSIEYFKADAIAADDYLPDIDNICGFNPSQYLKLLAQKVECNERF